MGITMILLVPRSLRDQADGGTHFRQLKGPADPRLTMPGQLRHRFDAVNTSLNLVHGSDDGLAALRESTIFFGDDRVLRALTAHVTVSPTWRRVVLGAVTQPPVDLDPVRAAVRLRSSVALRHIQGRAPQVVKALDALEGVLSGEPSMEAVSAALTSLRKAEACSPMLNDPFATIVRDVSLLDMSHSDALRLIAAVKGSGVAVSRWQHLTLETSAFYGQMTSRLTRFRG